MSTKKKPVGNKSPMQDTANRCLLASNKPRKYTQAELEVELERNKKPETAFDKMIQAKNRLAECEYTQRQYLVELERAEDNVSSAKATLAEAVAEVQREAASLAPTPTY